MTNLTDKEIDKMLGEDETKDLGCLEIILLIIVIGFISFIWQVGKQLALVLF